MDRPHLPYSRVHLAFDKFRGSLTQHQINKVITSILPATLEIHPYVLADGGEGSLDALYALGWTPVEITVADTLGRAKKALVARHRDLPQFAIELAEICGVKWLNGGLEPAASTTLGIGQAIEELRKLGAQEIILLSGGSASSDGGLGVLQGLGIRVTDQKQQLVSLGLSGLAHAVTIDRDDVQRVRNLFAGITFTMIHDTHASLIGPANSINLFSAQKGLVWMKRFAATRAFKRWARLLTSVAPDFDPNKPGTGAAGGVTSAFAALFGAHFVNGFEYFSYLTGLTSSLRPHDLLFTGEGRFDKTSRQKKIVMPAIELAQRQGADCVVVVGSITPNERKFLKHITSVKRLFVVSDYALSDDDSIANAASLIEKNLAHQLRELV